MNDSCFDRFGSSTLDYVRANEPNAMHYAVIRIFRYLDFLILTYTSSSVLLSPPSSSTYVVLPSGPS